LPGPSRGHADVRSGHTRGSWLLCVAAVGFIRRGKDHYFLTGECGRAHGNTGGVLRRLALESGVWTSAEFGD